MLLYHPYYSLFFFNDTATTEIYTLSLHDALPICREFIARLFHRLHTTCLSRGTDTDQPCLCRQRVIEDRKSTRLNSSHTVISYAVFCLKKKKKNDDANSKQMQHHEQKASTGRVWE